MCQRHAQLLHVVNHSAILKILNVFLWLHRVKRQRNIIFFLELEQNSTLFKGLEVLWNMIKRLKY